MYSRLWSIVGTIILSVVILGQSAATEQLRKWNFPVQDIHGKPITIETFLDRVTVIYFSTQQSKTKDMELGQEIGARFGLKRGYQSIAIPNTSDVPMWARFVATIKIALAEKRAVREAVQRQQANGNMEITEEEIRNKIIFINDKDGKVWNRMGLSAAPTNSFLGVIDRTGTMVYLQEAPINRDKLFGVLGKQFAGENTRWSTWSVPRTQPTPTNSSTGSTQTQEQ
jgi:hypothetical protein